MLLLLFACVDPEPSTDPVPSTDPCAFELLEVSTPEPGVATVLYGPAMVFSVDVGGRVQSASDEVFVLVTAATDPEGQIATGEQYLQLDGWDEEACTGDVVARAFFDPTASHDVCALEGRPVQLEMTVEPLDGSSPASTLSLEATARVDGVVDDPC